MKPIGRPKGIPFVSYVSKDSPILTIDENTPVDIGKIVRGQRLGNKCRNTYLGTKCAKCGKEWWALRHIGRNSDSLCTACSLLNTWENVREKKFGIFKGIPKVGEIRTGTELGKRSRSSLIWYKCPSCGKERWVDYSIKYNRPSATYCLQCKLTKIKQEKDAGIRKRKIMSVEARRKVSIAKGGTGEGRCHIHGYITVKIEPDSFFYSMADKKGHLLEHRLIMAQYLNRCLLPWEVVHHKNGIKDDNRIENLELITDKRFHLVDSITKSYIKKLETKITKLEKIIKKQNEQLLLKGGNLNA